MTETKNQFVLCLRNEGAEDLQIRKVYAVLSDDDALTKGMLRIIDDSGEDYLYPEEFFVPVALPDDVATQLRGTSTRP